MDEIKSFDFVLNAEQDLAGAILLYPVEAVADVREILRADDFQDDVCRNIFSCAVRLIDEKKPTDATMIAARLADDGQAVSNETLAELMKRFLTMSNVKATAELIHSEAVKRMARKICYEGATGSKPALDVITDLQNLVNGQDSGIPSVSDASNDFYDFIMNCKYGQGHPFLKTGYNELDSVLGGGLVASGLITLAARPGTGKTTAALNICSSIAETGGRILYFSLEMDSRQLWARRVAIVSGLSYSKIYRGEFTEEQETGPLIGAMETLSRQNFRISAKPATIEDIERIVHTARDGLDLVVIDHIGLISGNARNSRYEQMTNISHRLKQLAISTGIPILALCQLNRASEMRDDKRPTMADLRDSGAIEEDSDSVILLDRPCTHMPQDQRPKPWEAQDIDFIVDKNRNGAQGLVTMDFYGMSARIRERGQH